MLKRVQLNFRQMYQKTATDFTDITKYDCIQQTFRIHLYRYESIHWSTVTVLPIYGEIQLCEGPGLAVDVRKRPPRYKEAFSYAEREVINHQIQMLNSSLPWVLLAVESTWS